MEGMAEMFYFKESLPLLKDVAFFSIRRRDESGDVK